jgi:hypothetical protein
MTVAGDEVAPSTIFKAARAADTSSMRESKLGFAGVSDDGASAGVASAMVGAIDDGAGDKSTGTGGPGRGTASCPSVPHVGSAG